MRRALIGILFLATTAVLLLAFSPRGKSLFSGGANEPPHSHSQSLRGPKGRADVSAGLASASLLQDAAGTPFRFYRFERGIRVRYGNRDLVDLKLGGRLAVRELKPRLFELSLQMDSPVAAAGSIPRYRVLLTESAQIEKVEVEAALPESTARMAEDLIAQYFFFQSRDTQGEFQARISEKDPRHFEKSKTAYLNPPYSLAEISESIHSLTISEKGEIERIQGRETLITGSGSAASGEALRTSTDYRIAADPTASLVIATGSLAAPAWSEKAIFQATSPGSGRLTAGDAAVSLEGVPPTRDLLARIRKLDSKEASLSLYRALVKRLSSSRDDVAAGVAALGDFKSQPRALRLIIGALATTSSPEAHQALQAAYGDSSFPAPTREMILNAWTATEAPIPAPSRNFLKSIDASGDTESWEKQGALLALAAQVPRAPDVATRVEIEELLQAKLAQAQLVPQRLAALDAIGNSGSVNLVSSVRDFLSDPDDSVRARAFLALRRIPGAEVETILLNGRSDHSPSVRRSVELALSMRDSSLASH